MGDRLERDEDRRDRLAIAIGDMAATIMAGRFAHPDFNSSRQDRDAICQIYAHDAAVLLFYAFREADQVFKA